MQKSMHKQIIEYTSPLDALIDLTKQLNTYEINYQMNSEEFFAKYNQGETSDDEVFVEWAANYQHYLALHQYIKSKFRDVA
ncbi:antitoxin TumA [Nostoc sp. UIC 10890]